MCVAFFPHWKIIAKSEAMGWIFKELINGFEVVILPMPNGLERK